MLRKVFLGLKSKISKTYIPKTSSPVLHTGLSGLKTLERRKLMWKLKSFQPIMGMIDNYADMD